jgi:hypothetical protein
MGWNKPNITGNIVVSGNVDGRDASADGSKLDGIEAGATADMTAGEIKTAYESNADTNAFDDAAVSKLAGIEAGAEVNTVDSDPTGITGASQITNMVFISQLDYDNILVPSPTTMYVIV